MNVTKNRILDLIAIICSPNKGYKTVLAIDYSERMLMSEISTGCGFYNNLLKKHRHRIRIIWKSPLQQISKTDNCGFFLVIMQCNNRYLLITSNVSVPSNLD